MSTTKLDVQQLKDMCLYVSTEMQNSKALLSKADQVIGDGDHGIGMARGFKAVEAKIKTEDFSDIEGLFRSVGMTLLSSIGGAAGAVFGSFFLGFSKGLSGKDYLTCDNISPALKIGLENVKKRGHADVGDKTMIDALQPAVNKAETLETNDIKSCLLELWRSAEEGVEKTKEMVAKVGKSKTLGERSLGFPDPGAISLSLIFKSMYEFIDQIETYQFK